ncbi:MAG TPA: hypothetical protein VLJ37_01030 [bacterium]|nr:hypothetical protein [bacterium]
MASHRVDRLTVLHPDLPDGKVTVELPWGSFPDRMQETLDALDANDDGTIVYSPLSGSSAPAEAEVVHANGTVDRFFRLFWSYEGVAPYARRDLSEATMDSRTASSEEIQLKLYNQAALSLLKDKKDPALFRLAGRVLATVADYQHLYELGEIARDRWTTTKDLRFVRVAEELFLEARRLAAPVRIGRFEWMEKIDASLQKINPVLDKADREALALSIQRPFLLASLGSPITADLETLKKDDGLVFFEVAVPKSWVEKSERRGETVEDSLIHYFTSIERPTLKGSPFQDAVEDREYPLIPAAAEEDQPGATDDRIDVQSSFHVNQDRMNRVLFEKKKGDMVYYRVGFRLPSSVQALGGRSLRRFDLKLTLGEDQGTREVPGAFILQDMADKTSRDVFATDLHLSERDYDIVRVLLESMAEDVSSGNAPDSLPEDAAAIERFYESVNENVEASFESWNDLYRQGKIDRVFLLGDLADFVNLGLSLQKQGFRSTNLRRLQHILSKAEFPLLTVTGNHDHRGQGFATSNHRRNFVFQEGLQKYYEKYFDKSGTDHPFAPSFPGNLYWNGGIRALIMGTCSNDADCLDSQILDRLNSDNPWKIPNDGFLGHQLREIGTYETYGTGLGNGFRVFLWPTESEDFYFANFLLKDCPDPVGILSADSCFWRGLENYWVKQEPNGMGPNPENFLAFVNELKTAQSRGERVILGGHYPVISTGTGPDGVQAGTDTLKGDVAWSVRLASYYFRSAQGDPVLAASISGHVHHYEEYDFWFHFHHFAEEKHKKEHHGESFTGMALQDHIDEMSEEIEVQFRKELGDIFDQADTSLYARLEDFRERWHLDDITHIRQVSQAGAEGFPGPVVREVNKDSSKHGRNWGTAFVNAPAIGPPADVDQGYLIVTTKSDGTFAIEPRFVRRAGDGRILDVPGTDLESLRKGRWQEIHDWDPSRAIAPFVPLQGRTVSRVNDHTLRPRRTFDFLPLIYQYPAGKIGLNLDLTLQWDSPSATPDTVLGGELVFPLNDHVNTRRFGHPNYVALGAAYSFENEDLKTRFGIDWGQFRTDVTLENLSSAHPMFGGELLWHTVLPPQPGVGVWINSDFEGNVSGGLMLRATPTLLTVRP